MSPGKSLTLSFNCLHTYRVEPVEKCKIFEESEVMISWILFWHCKINFLILKWEEIFDIAQILCHFPPDSSLSRYVPIRSLIPFMSYFLTSSRTELQNFYTTICNHQLRAIQNINLHFYINMTHLIRLTDRACVGIPINREDTLVWYWHINYKFNIPASCGTALLNSRGAIWLGGVCKVRIPHISSFGYRMKQFLEMHVNTLIVWIWHKTEIT